METHECLNLYLLWLSFSSGVRLNKVLIDPRAYGSRTYAYEHPCRCGVDMISLLGEATVVLWI